MTVDEDCFGVFGTGEFGGLGVGYLARGFPPPPAFLSMNESGGATNCLFVAGAGAISMTAKCLPIVKIRSKLLIKTHEK